MDLMGSISVDAIKRLGVNDMDDDVWQDEADAGEDEDEEMED